MIEDPRIFTRLVLGLQPNAPARALEVAVDIADVLHLDLLGLFLEDESLRDFAKIPFARELSLTGGWRAVDHDRMVHELEIAARSVERAFVKAVKGRAGTSRFEVMRGPATRAIETMSSSTDIVVIAEPASVAERSAAPYSSLFRSALRSSAAVLIVPPTVARRRGPIVALAASPQDSAIESASDIASATKEELVIVGAHAGGATSSELQRRGLRKGLAARWLQAGKRLSGDPWSCVAALRLVEERLIVMSRSASDGDFAAAVAAARQTPVLVIEDPRAEARPDSD